jgi:hypothetical protein
MLSPLKFYKRMQRELHPSLEAMNELFQLPTVPDILLYLDNDLKKEIPENYTFVTYNIDARQIRFFPKIFVRDAPDVIKRHKLYLPDICTEDFAILPLIHEGAHGMHHATGGFRKFPKVTTGEKMVMEGICEGVAYYATRYALMKMQLPDLWVAELLYDRDYLRKFRTPGNPEKSAEALTQLIAFNYLGKFIVEGDGAFRKFVRQRLDAPSEEEIDEKMTNAFQAAKNIGIKFF